MNKQPTTWISGLVLHGDQTGRTINFPSLNLEPSLWPANLRTSPGVYAAKVRVGGNEYMGALYYGPRLVKGETHNVLEIHVLDFTADVYDQFVEFQVGAFVRPPMDFISLLALKEQLASDVSIVKSKLLR